MRQWKAAVIRSDRKTLSLQVKPDGTLVVRAPRRLPQKEIDRFLEEKSEWIERALEKVKETNAAGEEAPLDPADIHALAEQALRELPPRVRFWAGKLGVTYGRITIRNQRGRWGSCSGEGNLNFNCLLMLAPPEVVDYVIVHELAHRKQMNHSPLFWAEVEAVLPDYREQKKWLKDRGKILLARMRSGAGERMYPR